MLFAAHAERRYATQASTQLLDLYWQQRSAQPDLADRVLYEGVVAQRLGPDASRAGEIVRRAEESFTEWPVERELKFRHVVHYLNLRRVHALRQRTGRHEDQYGRGGGQDHSRRNLTRVPRGPQLISEAESP